MKVDVGQIPLITFVRTFGWFGCSILLLCR